MAEPAAARPLKAVTDPDADGTDGGGLAGRVLDIAGIAAGVVLAVIVTDIVTGGKITAWILRRRKGDCGECGDQAQEGGGGDG